MPLYSVETDSTIDFSGNYVLGDRYYNNVRINQFVHAQNGTFIGTLGKGKGGPPEFNAGGKAQKVARTSSSTSVSSSAVSTTQDDPLIASKGSLSARWAVTNLPGGGKMVYTAMSSGTGKMCLLTTTDESLTNRWSLQTAPKEKQTIWGRTYTYLDETVNSLFTCLKNTPEKTHEVYSGMAGLIHLTTHQRGAEWFLLRKFILTSRSVYAMLTIVYRYFPTVAEDITSFCATTSSASSASSARTTAAALACVSKCFRLHRKYAPKPEAGVVPRLNSAEIDEMGVKELKAWLELHGLSKSGIVKLSINSNGYIVLMEYFLCNFYIGLKADLAQRVADSAGQPIQPAFTGDDDTLILAPLHMNSQSSQLY